MDMFRTTHGQPYVREVKFDDVPKSTREHCRLALDDQCRSDYGRVPSDGRRHPAHSERDRRTADAARGRPAFGRRVVTHRSRARDKGKCVERPGGDAHDFACQEPTRADGNPELAEHGTHATRVTERKFRSTRRNGRFSAPGSEARPMTHPFGLTGALGLICPITTDIGSTAHLGIGHLEFETQ